MDEPTKPAKVAAAARTATTVTSKKTTTAPRKATAAKKVAGKPAAARKPAAPRKPAAKTEPVAAQSVVEAPPAPVDDVATDDVTTAVPTITGVMKRPELPETQWKGGELASNAPPPLPDAPLAVLQANAISAWFGDRKVLDRVDLTMEAGKVTALIGPSGCGKSTFLRILNRMHEMIPSASLAGEVLLDGVDIYDANRRLTQARRDIGMVFQKPNPFPAMSIYDNVIAGLKLTGISASRDTKDQLVESSLTKAGLWKEVRDRLRQPGGGLSGGQQQRLCIARSLAVRPRVLLMDEPCSALDPTSTRVIEETMLELAKEVTIVIVTHNMQQAQRVSDNCAFFLASLGTPGAIVEQGDTAVMFSDPTDPRTLDYVNGRFG
jgi:phosphate transport system ATP-binding protein